MTRPDDLLQPSLAQADQAQKATYSSTAGYLTAFIGGPFAAVTMAGLNSWRLRRLGRDALPLVAAVALSAGLSVWLMRPEWLGLAGVEISGTNARFAARVLALLLFGGFWLLHRRYYRGAELLGLERPNPWLGGLACVLVGLAVSLLLGRWLAS